MLGREQSREEGRGRTWAWVRAGSLQPKTHRKNSVAGVKDRRWQQRWQTHRFTNRKCGEKSRWGSPWICSLFHCLLLPFRHKCCLKSCLFSILFFNHFYVRIFFKNPIDFLKASWRNVTEHISSQKQQGMFSKPVCAGFRWERNQRGLDMVLWCHSNFCSDLSPVRFFRVEIKETKTKKGDSQMESVGNQFSLLLITERGWHKKKTTWHPERRKTVPEERSQYLMYLHLRLAVRRTWCRDCSPWAAVENGLAVWANFWGVFWEIAVYSGKWALDSLLRDYCHRYWTWKNPQSLRSHSDLLYSGTAN